MSYKFALIIDPPFQRFSDHRRTRHCRPGAAGGDSGPRSIARPGWRGRSAEWNDAGRPEFLDPGSCRGCRAQRGRRRQAISGDRNPATLDQPSDHRRWLAHIARRAHRPDDPRWHRARRSGRGSGHHRGDANRLDWTVGADAQWFRSAHPQRPMALVGKNGKLSANWPGQAIEQLAFERG